MIQMYKYMYTYIIYTSSPQLTGKTPQNSSQTESSFCSHHVSSGTLTVGFWGTYSWFIIATDISWHSAKVSMWSQHWQTNSEEASQIHSKFMENPSQIFAMKCAQEIIQILLKRCMKFLSHISNLKDLVLSQKKQQQLLPNEEMFNQRTSVLGCKV